MMLFAIAGCLAAGFVVYAALATGWHRVATAPTLFLLLQAPFMVGILQHTDTADPVHVRYAAFVVFGLYAFVGGTLVANGALGLKPRRAWHRAARRDVELDAALPIGPLIILTLLSLGVGFAFVRAVGYNTFALALGGEATGQAFGQLRADATQSSYVAAGYAAQFTAVILPAIIYLLLIRARALSSWRLRILVVLLSIADLFFITAVGGRVYVLNFLVSYALLSSPSLTILPAWLTAPRRVRRLFIPIFLLVFFALTSLQGRFGASAGTANARPAAIESIVALYNRLGGDYTRDQLKAMERLSEDEIRWGSQWSQDFLTTLPGPIGEELLSTRLHREVYGSSQGNLPLNVWGSALYNWGFVLGVLVLFVFGLGMQWLSVRLLLRGRRVASSVVIGQLICLHLAVTYDPYSLLLEGSITLLVVRRMLARRSGVATRTSSGNLSLRGPEVAPIPS